MLEKEIYYDEGVGGKWSFISLGILCTFIREMQLVWEVIRRNWKWRKNTVHIHALVENALGELEYKRAIETGKNKKNEKITKNVRNEKTENLFPNRNEFTKNEKACK